jgi:hypothetical protein
MDSTGTRSETMDDLMGGAETPDTAGVGQRCRIQKGWTEMPDSKGLEMETPNWKGVLFGDNGFQWGWTHHFHNVPRSMENLGQLLLLLVPVGAAVVHCCRSTELAVCSTMSSHGQQKKREVRL